MTNKEITDAIFYLVPNAQFSFTEADLSTLEWHTADVAKPTIQAITAAIPLAKSKAEEELENLQTQKQALLDRLGITSEEAKLLLA
jgi:hypothetical protein